MNNFPEFIRFNPGQHVENFVMWLLKNFGSVFDAIGNAILWFMVNVLDILHWLPWWLVLAIIFILGWRLRNLQASAVFTLLLFLIGTFGLWDKMMETLAVILTSVILSLILGIPLGILITYNSYLEAIIKPILDAMQTMPSFVYLIPAMMLFGLGMVPAVFATIIYAIPPVIRLTALGINRVSKEMVEAANSFGTSSWQLLTKVQLPQALPTITTGVNQTTMMALAMAVIASMVGAKGLGMEVLISINRLDIDRGFESGISVVILAILIDRISQGIANKYKFTD